MDANIERVVQRAQGGGHGASERDIRAIYRASIGNLRAALAVFERTRIFDSTTRWAAPRLVGNARQEDIELVGATPEWLARALGAPPPS